MRSNARRRSRFVSSLPLLSRLSRRGADPTTLAPASQPRGETVLPPSLRCQPGGAWQRLLWWLMAPKPGDAAPAAPGLAAVRAEFAAALADGAGSDADRLRLRIEQAQSLRELWHARAEVYRVVAVALSQSQADERLALLNRHFPTRVPR